MVRRNVLLVRIALLGILLSCAPVIEVHAQSVTRIETSRVQGVRPTKYQREAAGLWRVIETQHGANVKWLAIYIGDSQDNMIVRWPTGLGCQNEQAKIRANTITIVGRNFPAAIQIRRGNTATLSLGQTILHMRKTKEKTDFLCE